MRWISRSLLPLEPYASADLGAASDVTGKSETVRGCVDLLADFDLTATHERRHRVCARRRRPLIGDISSDGE